MGATVPAAGDQTPATTSYRERRAWLTEYFDRTAAGAWATLTSDAPVSRIRATVRAGRDRMRATLAGYLPADLSGARVLDAGCGTGVLAVELAQRGAHVVAIDLSPTLVGLAESRAEGRFDRGRIDWRAGDMLDPALGAFDYVVAMDSLIHYRLEDMLDAYAALTVRTRCGVAATFAPRTPLLSVMHAVGSAFPRRDRAPAIEPVAPTALLRALGTDPRFADWRPHDSLRIRSGFYTSQALLLRRHSGSLVEDAR
jgi:magnesium-protoporphyrin O-methyltransferase